MVTFRCGHLEGKAGKKGIGHVRAPAVISNDFLELQVRSCRGARDRHSTYAVLGGSLKKHWDSNGNVVQGSITDKTC